VTLVFVHVLLILLWCSVHRVSFHRRYTSWYCFEWEQNRNGGGFLCPSKTRDNRINNTQRKYTIFCILPVVNPVES